MGQRLNIEIHENGKCLANAYYHWSGYTEDALSLTQKILDYFPSRKNKDGWICAYELLYYTGARFAPDELVRIGIDENIARALGMEANRNNGLIAVSEEGIEETRYWEEGRVEIDIGNNAINFSVLTKYKPYDFAWDDARYIDVPFDNHHIPFNSFNEFKSYFDEVEHKLYAFRNGEPLMAAIY